jgi:hypothetical protein
MLRLLLISLIMSSLNSFAQDKPVKDLLLSLSDAELVKAAMSGKTGKCSVVDARECPQCFCDYYAQSSKSGLQGVGLPHGLGSGCIVAPDAPKRVDICWGAPNVYDQYNNSKTPICGASLIKNAANMIRIGIQRDLCDLPVEQPKKDDLKACLDGRKLTEEELKKSRDTIASLTIELEKRKGQIDKDRGDCDKAKTELEKAKAELEKVKIQAESDRKERDKLKDENQKLKNQSEKDKQDLEKYKKELDEVKRKSKSPKASPPLKMK